MLLPHDWLTWRLTGRFATDRGDASGTGYWSPADGRATAPTCSAIVDARPRLVRRACPRCSGRSTPAGEWRGAVVGPGTGDNMAAALGLGLGRGDVAISIGTSGTVYAVSDAPTADPTGAVAGFADATGRFLPLVCTLNATKVTDAVARLLGVDLDELERSGPGRARRCGRRRAPAVPRRRAHAEPPDGHRRRSPACAPTSTRAQLARAAFEGVVCGLLDGLDALRRAPARSTPAASCWSAGAPGRRPTARSSPTCRAARCTSPPRPSTSPPGAAVQAAAVLHQRPAAEIVAAWGLGAGEAVEPGPGAAAAAEVRAAYAAAARPRGLTTDDPFAVLGLPATATLDEVRAARAAAWPRPLTRIVAATSCGCRRSTAPSTSP